MRVVIKTVEMIAHTPCFKQDSKMSYFLPKTVNCIGVKIAAYCIGVLDSLHKPRALCVKQTHCLS